jgi:hypothetical protein
MLKNVVAGHSAPMAGTEFVRECKKKLEVLRELFE